MKKLLVALLMGTANVGPVYADMDENVGISEATSSFPHCVEHWKSVSACSELYHLQNRAGNYSGEIALYFDGCFESTHRVKWCKSRAIKKLHEIQKNNTPADECVQPRLHPEKCETEPMQEGEAAAPAEAPGTTTSNLQPYWANRNQQ